MSAPAPSSNNAASSTSSITASLAASHISSTSDDESDEKFVMPRREFTPEERAAQQADQAAEEAMIRREEAELKEEQQKAAAMIRARRVKFTPAEGALPAATSTASASSSSSSSLIEFDTDDSASGLYDHFDKKRTRILFVESSGNALAPLAAAFVTSSHSNLLHATAARAQPDAPAAASVDEFLIQSVSSANLTLTSARYTLAALTQRADARFDFIVTLDETSKTAVAALTPDVSKRFGKAIHQPFTVPTSANEAEETKSKVKTFIDELPDLLSFYA